MGNEKEPTKLYRVRNGYAVTKGNQAIKQGNVALTDKEYTLQSWKVEAIVEKKETTEPHQVSEALPKELDKELAKEPNIDRSVKKSRFNRVMKISKG